ncbi:hypothetical protein BCF33_2300 [Hasllibacter halocynthiae]|uniref:GTP-binding protein Era n=1 Tax=Hasllibacter halocynthiae TaxID=595589 RepID=A0A2T0X3A7_9RHOB|nr:DUF1491 family protein [Hasllibacter halocynthiae]PRY93432.1 hypothetical protein BCF33_2300 [Hasllibacter halocynthiae]
MARLTSEMWVAAYLARLRGEAIPAFLAAKGDATAGNVLVKVATMDGAAKLFECRYDMMADRRSWEVTTEGPEGEVDASLARQRGFDRDLWVVEVEDPKGRHLLDDPGLVR